MEFRYHDIICWIFPGIFFMGMLILNDLVFDLGIIDFSIFHSNTQSPEEAKLDQGAVVTVLIFCIPVFGMIIGYILNYFASLMEWLSYKGLKILGWHIRLSRASEKILNQNSIRVRIGDSDNFYKFLRDLNPHGSLNFDNDSAEIALAKVKQAIERERLDTYYYKCTFGRNLAFAQTFIILFLFIFGFFHGFSFYVDSRSAWILLITDILFEIALFNAWRRNQLTYIKTCIVEYLKQKYPNV